MTAATRDHGTWSLRDVLSYAIGYARRGIHYVPRVIATLNTVRPLFESEWPTSAALWLRDGGPREGKLWANPVLADTWERLVREAEAAGHDRVAQIDAARDAWYGGFIADAIDRFCRTNEVMDTSGRRHRGVQLGGIAAARRGEVRSAPAAATGQLGQLPHQVARVGALGLGFRSDLGDKLHLALDGNPHYHDA
jgi:gamma-glutamyltranspeptidase/glutathione hydrolase